MPLTAAAGNAAPGSDVGRYQRHRPEQTLLYRIVEQHCPVFAAYYAAQGRGLPAYVQREFEDYLRCGRLEHGFLRVRCESCHAEQLVAFSCKRRGFCPSCGARRMAESAALLVDDPSGAHATRACHRPPCRELFGAAMTNRHSEIVSATR